MAHRVAIIGGGISGLTAAYYLQRDSRFEITLIEAESRLGGLLETRLVNGCLIEAGPDSFLAAKPAALELIADLGLADQVIASNDHQRRTYILKNGALVPMPEGLVLMAPTDFEALRHSSLLSPEAQARASRELDRQPPPTPLPDRSVAEFVEDHYGQEFVEWLAEPLLTGVFGGDCARLSVQKVLPRFVELENKLGSVSRGLAADRREKPSESLFKTLRGGFQQLVDALDSQINVRRIHSRAERIEPGWRVLTSGPAIEADSVILALRTWQAAPLIRNFAPELAVSLDAIPYSSAVTVGFTYPAAGFPHPLDGFGFLVPRREGRRIVACTWVHRKFDYRAPAGQLILRAFLGGEAWCQASDSQIIAAVREDFAAILGVAEAPQAVSIARWPRSMPQYEVGHLDRAAAIEHGLIQYRGLYLGGNSLDGIGIPDTIRRARTIASQLG
jgi:oxygen-dependent protoporphyrinogen oxidase